MLALNEVLRLLGHILPFLGLRQPVKDGVLDEVDINGSRPTFRSIFGFWDNVMGKGCRPVGLTTFRPTFVMYK
jgi:hypothetical protein